MDFSTPSTFELLALAYVAGVSLLDILIRAIQRTRDQAWAIATAGSWAGAAVFGAVADFRSAPFDLSIAALFLLSGVLWSAMVYWDLRAMESVDAASNVLISSLRSVLLIAAGCCWFGERMTVVSVAGSVVIVSGVLAAVPIRRGGWSRGVLFRLGSVGAGAGAIILDKVLVGMTDIRLVVLAGYLLPGIVYLFVRPPAWREELRLGPPARIRLLVAAIVLYVAIGPAFVGAFGLGAMSSTFAITQSRIVVTLILGAVLLGERDRLVPKAIGAALVVAGISLVVLGA